MKNNRIIRIVLLVLMLVFGGAIVFYYWQHDTLESMKRVPVFVMIMALCYIVIQIAKRFYFKKQNWWDWLYYIGLLAVVSPTFFVNEANVSAFLLLTDIGTLFLLVPILFDGKQLIGESNIVKED